MKPIQQIIGENFCKIRKRMALSLDKVSEKTGVSKAILAQIERGEANPTVSTLWKIANGLHVSFSALMKEEAASVQKISLSNIPAISDDNEKYKVYPMFTFEIGKPFEVFEAHLEPGHVHQSDEHAHGVQEILIIQKGALEIVIDGCSYVVREGEAIRFAADKKHDYKNITDQKVKYYVIIYYPEN
ncbi:helix-turn-helix domain-containing protein [Aeribacillus pallidus]|uniref:DNA-binding protein n=1 Tax=Aeribacillus pallidus TaxID=33936 RepID=A0A165YH24_9BACI|nr:XRE family transcriptional regulator [Aeribacillus pallidus]KZN97070.1 DNA-binding protein [Aeribacillus pallidus]